MQERAERYGGKQRSHTLTTAGPFVVVVLDEMAFLTAYHPDRDIRRRAENAIATLTSQGRSVGFCVLAALQDPRKEVMPSEPVPGQDRPEVGRGIAGGHGPQRRRPGTRG